MVFFILGLNANGQTITTIAGGGPVLGDNGPANLAQVLHPFGGQFDAAGNYYFLQSLSSPRLRMIDTAGIIRTVAGNGTQGFSGDGALATSAQLSPSGCTVDSAGNIYIADRYNYRIRKVNAATHVITTIAGNGTQGFSGDGNSAILAQMDPFGICVDKVGNLYIIDGGLRVRKIDTSGIINTIAGNGTAGFNGDGGLAINAELNLSYGICVDEENNLYLACATRIRKVNLTTGIISKVGGTGYATYIGDGMHADSAQFNAINIGIDGIGAIYIADYVNDRVLKIDTAGIFHSIAGTGVSGYNGDNGLADTAQLYNPEGVTVDNCGNLYIADGANGRIRKVTFYPTCTPTVAKNVNEINAINIYPNPVHNEVTIMCGDNMKSTTVLNVIGQTLLQQNCNGNKATINVSQLQSGMYFIKVTDKNGGVVTKRFVKE